MTSVAIPEPNHEPVKRADDIIEQLRKREIKFNSKNLQYRVIRINHFLDVKMNYEEAKLNPRLNHMINDFAQRVVNAYDILVANNIVEDREALIDNEQKALEIVRQIQDREIIINPNAELWISDEIQDILKCYQDKETNPLNKAFVNRVFTIYNIIVSRGLIEQNTDEEKEALKKEVIKLRKEIEDIEKANKPEDTFTSEATRE